MENAKYEHKAGAVGESFSYVKLIDGPEPLFAFSTAKAFLEDEAEKSSGKED